jgi:hypothetical protein
MLNVNGLHNLQSSSLTQAVKFKLEKSSSIIVMLAPEEKNYLLIRPGLAPVTTPFLYSVRIIRLHRSDIVIAASGTGLR